MLRRIMRAIGYVPAADLTALGTRVRDLEARNEKLKSASARARKDPDSDLGNVRWMHLRAVEEIARLTRKVEELERAGRVSGDSPVPSV